MIPPIARQGKPLDIGLGTEKPCFERSDMIRILEAHD
jgi:hypothetical protein